MYLWKYWRESRIAVFISTICIALLLVVNVRIHPVTIANPGAQPATGWLLFVLPLQALPLSFLAWIFGSFGVGRNLGELSGSYIFTRPKARAFFVWRDWGFGLMQLFVIVVVVNLVLGFSLHRTQIAMGEMGHGYAPFPRYPISQTTIVSMNCALAFLLTALVFSLSYFSTVLVRSSKGLMVAAGALLAFSVIKFAVLLAWPWINFPALSPLQFTQLEQGVVTGFAPHLGISVAIRVAIILLFPIGALFLLQKRDIE